MQDCIFCKIGKHEESAHIIYETDTICCFLDIDPINEGHVLIIPKKHCLDLWELEKETAQEIMIASQKIGKIVQTEFNAEGISIMQNGGIFNDTGHYHLHIFPRYKNDGFSWNYSQDIENPQLENVCTRLSKKIYD